MALFKFVFSENGETIYEYACEDESEEDAYERALRDARRGQRLNLRGKDVQVFDGREEREFLHMTDELVPRPVFAYHQIWEPRD